MENGRQPNSHPTFLEKVSGMNPNPSFLEALGGLIGFFTGMFVGLGLANAHVFGDPRTFELLGKFISFAVHMVGIPIVCMRIGVRIGQAANSVVVLITCAGLAYLEWLLRGAFFMWFKGFMSGLAG